MTEDENHVNFVLARVNGPMQFCHAHMQLLILHLEHSTVKRLMIFL